jgi:hypothetical protein
MNKLDSFDNNKKKCKICSDYSDGIWFILGYCKKCWENEIKRSKEFRQTGKSSLSWYIFEKDTQVLQNKENEQQTR